MNICLVRPPVFDPDFRTYPLNIEYISSSLKKDGHHVSFVDGERIAGEAINQMSNKNMFLLLKNLVQSKEKIISRNINLVDFIFQSERHPLWIDIANQILLSQPDMIGFSCYTESMSATRMIIETLREQFNLTVPVVLGGIHPSVAPVETMKNIPGVDFIVCGEGEKVIRDLVKAMEGKGKKPGDIKGICYREKGNIKLTPKSSLIEDLSQLPILDFDFALPDHNFVILTSRGCPFNCNFCSSKNMWSKKVRYRPADHVLEEISNLIGKMPLKSVRFGDDTFTLNKNHMKAIAWGLKDKGIHLPISVGSRIDTMDKEKLGILKSMNVKHISFGVETGSKEIIKQIKKDLNLDDVVPTVKMVNDEGIRSTTYFIINHPHETKTNMYQSFNLMKQLVKVCNLNIVRLNTGFPYPGTEWWAYVCEKDLISHFNFYKKPTTYNHLGPPVVNMSSESMEELVAVKARIDGFLSANRWRRKVKDVIKNPSILVKRISNLLK